MSSGTTDHSCEVTDNPMPTEAEIQFILKEIRNYLSPDVNGNKALFQAVLTFAALKIPKLFLLQKCLVSLFTKTFKKDLGNCLLEIAVADQKRRVFCPQCVVATSFPLGAAFALW